MAGGGEREREREREFPTIIGQIRSGDPISQLQFRRRRFIRDIKMISCGSGSWTIEGEKFLGKYVRGFSAGFMFIAV